MKQRMIVTTMGMGLSFMLSAPAWSAPKVASPPPKPSSPDQIRVETVEGTVSGTPEGEQTGMSSLHEGGSESWVMRADDTANHFATYDAFTNMQGGHDIDDAIGLLPPGTFNKMLDYLQWTHLLDRKASSPNVGGLRVTLTRGGQSKSVVLSNGSSLEMAAASTTQTLVDSFTRKVAWKTAAQFKAATGLAATYLIAPLAEETDEKAAATFPRPIFSVLDAAGKEIAVLRPNTDKERAAFLSRAPLYGFDEFSDDYAKNKQIDSFLTLAPGTYHLKFKTLASPDPGTGTSFVWSANDDTLTIKPGLFYAVQILLQKKLMP